MKTKIIALTLAAFAATTVFNASAHKPGKAKGPRKARTECVEAARRDCDKACDRNRADARVECDADRDCLFLEGITLTPEQQVKVDNLKKERRAEMEKKHKKLMKERKEKADKKREKAAKRQEKARKKAEKRWEKMEKEMKEILTPQQYGQFRQNMEKAKQAREKRFEKRRSSKPRPGSPKADCKAAPCPAGK